MTNDVFVVFHPFLAIWGKSPKRDFGGPYAVLPSGRVVGQAPASARKNPLISVIRPTEAEQSSRLAIGEMTKTSAKQVSWETVRKGANFSALADIQSALYSISAPSDSPYRDDKMLSALVDYCDRESIFFPSGGFFPPSLEKNVGTILKRIDEKAVVFEDEFGLQKTEIGVEDLAARDSVVLRLPLDVRGRISSTRLKTLDGRFACHTMESAFYTIVRTSVPMAAEILSQEFDGFWCDPKLSDGWWIR